MSMSGCSRDVKFPSGGVLYVGFQNVTVEDFASGDEGQLLSQINEAMQEYERKQRRKESLSLAAVVPVDGLVAEVQRA